MLMLKRKPLFTIHIHSLRSEFFYHGGRWYIILKIKGEYFGGLVDGRIVYNSFKCKSNNLKIAEYHLCKKYSYYDEDLLQTD